MAERIRPIVKTMKKDTQGQWNDQCEVNFGEVKEILASPPIGRLDLRHDLQLFLAITNVTISATLVQKNPEFKTIYFVSRILKDSETRYQQLEKVVLALLTAASCLRPYFQGHQVVVKTYRHVAKRLRKPDLTGRIVGWSIELLEF